MHLIAREDHRYAATQPFSTACLNAFAATALAFIYQSARQQKAEKHVFIDAQRKMGHIG